MEFLYSITLYKCVVYNIPEKLQMITTFSTYYRTDLVFPVIRNKIAKSFPMWSKGSIVIAQFSKFKITINQNSRSFLC